MVLSLDGRGVELVLSGAFCRNNHFLSSETRGRFSDERVEGVLMKVELEEVKYTEVGGPNSFWAGTSFLWFCLISDIILYGWSYFC